MKKFEYDAHFYTYESVLLSNTVSKKITVVEAENAYNANSKITFVEYFYLFTWGLFLYLIRRFQT